MKLKEEIQKLRERWKHFGIREWGVVLLVGICLLIIVFPANKPETEGLENTTREEVQERMEITVSENSYTEKMECRVEELLSQVENVGKVKVMLTVSSTEEKTVLKDGTQERQETTEKDSEGGSRVKTEENTDFETVFEGSAPYILSEQYPQVVGVVVIAQGSGTGSVDYDILNAVQVLFDIPAHKIKIMKMK